MLLTICVCVNKQVVFHSAKHERFHYCLLLLRLEGKGKLKLLKVNLISLKGYFKISNHIFSRNSILKISVLLPL